MARGRSRFGKRSHLSRHLRFKDELQNGFERHPHVFESKYDPEIPYYLEQYFIPGYIYDSFIRENIDSLHLDEPLSRRNYIRRFQDLLWIEEAFQEIEMRAYDKHNVRISKFDIYNKFQLTVHGLAEGRPSLVAGDKLLLQVATGPVNGYMYEGYICRIRENDIIFKLKFGDKSTQVDKLLFNVMFVSQRVANRRCHDALNKLRRNPYLEKILFEENQDEISEPLHDIDRNSNLKCYYPKHDLNPIQKRAVINILRAECRPAPYIVFGPPGTGKTITIVEAILQIYMRDSTAKILVCGNSNSCADVMAMRIKETGIIPWETMIRIVARYRYELDDDGYNLIPKELEDISVPSDDVDPGIYNSCQIVITTCNYACSLNWFKARFDYVFVDEAGHANEPETLIPIGLLKGEDSCVVLAGDPLQMGPIVFSPVAEEHGLGKSLLERTFNHANYRRRGEDGDQQLPSDVAYDPRYLTKLLINYRSDKRVLSICNEVFYNNELRFVIKTPKELLKALNFKFPLVMHHVKGVEERTHENPSWYNDQEAALCLQYLHKIYLYGLKPDQVGIISPYKQQIARLLELMDRMNLRRCKVSTVEGFQGDERNVILVSTVRSNSSNRGIDERFKLGFLFNPKRFNVALSRAMWLVIVIGNENILRADENWKRFTGVAERFEEVL